MLNVQLVIRHSALHVTQTIFSVQGIVSHAQHIILSALIVTLQVVSNVQPNSFCHQQVHAKLVHLHTTYCVLLVIRHSALVANLDTSLMRLHFNVMGSFVVMEFGLILLKHVMMVI